jgi:hypothetical protein
MWDREQTIKANNPHYHVLALTNGHALQNGYYIQKSAERQWNNVLKTTQKGLVNECNQNGPNTIKINKYTDDYSIKLEQAKHQANYLAKTHTNELNPKGSWRCSGTRIKNKQ